MRRAVLFMLFFTVWFSTIVIAEETGQSEQAQALMKSFRKGGMTEVEAQKVASLGPDVLPVVYDALFSTNEFQKGAWACDALRVLAHTGNTNAVPKIKQYIERGSRMSRRFEALRAILEINNTPEVRDYVVETANQWMTNEVYRYDMEFGFGRLLNTDIPKEDMVAIINRLAVDKFIFRISIFRQLAYRADDIAIPVLKYHLQSKDPKHVKLVEDGIRIGHDSLRKEADKWSSFTVLDNFKHPPQRLINISQQDINDRYTTVMETIGRLEKAFPAIIGTNSVYSTKGK
ncbi:MAG: hypothetical protein PHR77_14660 [Kiritimatiellae bacterium]|nr:hypothetical protein [Kiritimatiellia bacterium]MDD5521261.1 hypothetical protein [Kiritimatiellia bacterium]